MFLKFCVGFFLSLMVSLVGALIISGLSGSHIIYQPIGGYMAVGAFVSFMIAVILGFYIPPEPYESGDWR